MGKPIQKAPLYKYKKGHPLFYSSVIVINAHEVAGSFAESFATVRKGRGARGTSKDKEQDILRAMLLFASSGLDAVIKQLIKDALPLVIEANAGAKRFFADQIEKMLRKRSTEEGKDIVSIKVLAEALSDRSPREVLIKRLIGKLLDESMQSVDQLYQAAAHFGITPKEVYKGNVDELREVFSIRNKIGHEMDVDFEQSNRRRSSRTKDDMVKYANMLLKIADAFLRAVESKLMKKTNREDCVVT